MNFVTLILSLLLLLSFGTLTLLEKEGQSRRIRSTFLGHLKANRKILSQTERQVYRTIQAKPKETPSEKEEKPQTSKEKTAAKAPPINPLCARINLWPLVQEGKEKQPALYQTVAKLLRLFYGANLFSKENSGEYPFLDLLLKRLKEQIQKDPSLTLEKLNLKDPKSQGIYYRMLKGSKKASDAPSLLDLIRLDEEPLKICLTHAHPNIFHLFFGPKIGNDLFQELHQEKPPAISKEWIEKHLKQAHFNAFDPILLEWFVLGRPKHPETSKITWIGEDSESAVSLRKTVYPRPT